MNHSVRSDAVSAGADDAPADPCLRPGLSPSTAAKIACGLFSREWLMQSARSLGCAAGDVPPSDPEFCERPEVFPVGTGDHVFPTSGDPKGTCSGHSQTDGSNPFKTANEMQSILSRGWLTFIASRQNEKNSRRFLHLSRLRLCPICYCAHGAGTSQDQPAYQ